MYNTDCNWAHEDTHLIQKYLETKRSSVDVYPFSLAAVWLAICVTSLYQVAGYMYRTLHVFLSLRDFVYIYIYICTSYVVKEWPVTFDPRPSVVYHSAHRTDRRCPLHDLDLAGRVDSWFVRSNTRFLGVSLYYVDRSSTASHTGRLSLGSTKVDYLGRDLSGVWQPYQCYDRYMYHLTFSLRLLPYLRIYSTHLKSWFSRENKK